MTNERRWREVDSYFAKTFDAQWTDLVVGLVDENDVDVRDIGMRRYMVLG